MGNIAYELLALLIVNQLLLRLVRQLFAHLLKVAAEDSDLVLGIDSLHGEVQISLHDILSCLCEAVQWMNQVLIYPGKSQQHGHKKNQHNRTHHTLYHICELGNICALSNDKNAVLVIIRHLHVKLAKDGHGIPFYDEAASIDGSGASECRQ